MYDVIVVGARAAGSPLALRLSRGGLNVLVVDKATFPSDTLSTHMLTGDSVERLDRWGVLEEILGTDLPAMSSLIMAADDFAVEIQPRSSRYPVLAPRRSVLDTVLVNAARDAGAEIREGFSVQSLIGENGRICGIVGRDRTGKEVVERARLVVGADGRHSFVARQVNAEKYNERPVRAVTYFSYYAGWTGNASEIYHHDGASVYVFPTNWGLACIGGYWPATDLAEVRKDPEAALTKLASETPQVADRFKRVRRMEQIQGSTGTAAYYRKSAGPGWALVGDAAYLKDPILASGIADAFRDADYTADAILAGFSAAEGTVEEHLLRHEARRAKATAASYELNDTIAAGAVSKETMLMLQAVVRAAHEARAARAA